MGLMNCVLYYVCVFIIFFFFFFQAEVGIRDLTVTGVQTCALPISSAVQIIGYLKDGSVANAVNMVAVEPALMRKVAAWQQLSERLGAMHGQLLQGRVRRVVIAYAGEAFGANERKLLTLAVLKGFLGRFVEEPVNYVNASHFARQHGLDVVEQTSLRSEDFVNLISVSVESDTRARRLAGTIFGQRQPRIVHL